MSKSLIRKHCDILNCKNIHSQHSTFARYYYDDICDSIMVKIDIKQDNCKVQFQLYEKIVRSMDEINSDL